MEPASFGLLVHWYIFKEHETTRSFSIPLFAAKGNKHVRLKFIFSGGQLNPIITLIQMVRKVTPPLVGLCYLGAHLAGAALGALSVEVR